MANMQILELTAAKPRVQVVLSPARVDSSTWRSEDSQPPGGGYAAWSRASIHAKKTCCSGGVAVEVGVVVSWFTDANTPVE